MAWFDNQHGRQIEYTRERIEKLEKTQDQDDLIKIVAEKARALNELLAEFRDMTQYDKLMSPWRYHATECVNLDSLTKNYYFDLV